MPTVGLNMKGEKVPVGDVSYYDVNSLYPYVMRSEDMPLGNVTYVEGENLPLKDIFGFCYVNVIAPDMKRPILPIRLGGKLLVPTGE